jgi:hypothetical protein
VSYVKKKWEANKDKVAFAKDFPGRQTDWKAVAGKTLEAVVPFQAHGEGDVLVFTDGEFIIARQLPDTPQTLMAALEAARDVLGRFHQEAYEKLDALSARDREMRRMARMERIVDAVQNNMGEIPELRAALKALL